MMRPDGSYLEELNWQMEALATELGKLARVSVPDLTDAPVLEHWRLSHRAVPTLMGRVSGHPLLVGRRDIYTSQLYAMDAEAGWARTFSRYYRLGTPWEGPLPLARTSMPGDDQNVPFLTAL